MSHPRPVSTARRFRSFRAALAGLAASAMALAGCQTPSASVAPQEDLLETQVSGINGGRTVRIDIVLATGRPDAFGGDKVADRWYDELCHDRQAWDRSGAIWATWDFDPTAKQGERLKAVDGDTDRILEGLQRKEAKKYRYAAVFWWYRDDGERAFRENTEIEGPFVLLLDREKAEVEWEPSEGLLEDLGSGLEDLGSALEEAFGNLLGRRDRPFDGLLA